MSATTGRRSGRTILHVDMDAFYVEVELRRHPDLRGRPVIVGGRGRRGVVAAASYEARAAGVRSAMPSVVAERRCPTAVFLPGDHRLYGQASAAVHAILHRFTPLVEGIALDEAFLDVTGSARLFGSGAAIAGRIRGQIAREVGLPCSVGVAPTKLLAKLASEAAKPSPSPSGPQPGPGVVVVRSGEELAFLHPHRIEALWGVGPATAERLHRLGVATVGDLATLPLRTVVGALGEAVGQHLHALARGVDDRPVVPDRPPKSIGHEETYGDDLQHADAVERELLRLADAVAARLRRHALASRTITVKVRFGDFRTVTRSATLPRPVDTMPEVLAAARVLVEGIDVSSGVRLLGISGSGLTAERSRQLPLLDEAAPWDAAASAVDAIRERFGPGAIGPAALVEPAGTTRQPGPRPWGPDSPAGRG